MKAVAVYLEVGDKRVWACAVEWPGWCRSGPDEIAALEALLDYGPRYAAVMHSARLGFRPPERVQQLQVVERIGGNATTDFGAPGVVPAIDTKSADSSDCARFEKVLRAAWRAFDAACKRAAGKTLSKGPRGGGRDLAGIVRHVVEADRAYLGGVGWKFQPSAKEAAALDETRAAILEAVRASARGEIPARGPRGGRRWPVRYFVRRVAWHVIAHGWEIQRRSGDIGSRTIL